MWRLCYTIARNICILPGIIDKMRRMAEDTEEYSEEDCYRYLQYIVDLMQRTGCIRTEVFGTENLPEEGGYIMYPNHQGRYDAYGIVSGHEKPCTVVMDQTKSHVIFVREVLDLVRGKRLDKQNIRQAFAVIHEVAQEVEKGRRYIIFPEGIYDNSKKNSLGEFKAGCFKASLQSRTPIVPVALIDSYKPFNSNCFGTVTTQVHFLPPISYEEYQDLKTTQIAALVKERIRERIHRQEG